MSSQHHEGRRRPVSDAPRDHAPFEPRTRRARLWILALAILLPQIALFWPSLTGRKVLLPLDVLATRSIWIAPGEPEHLEECSDEILSDLAFVTEVNRRYTAEAVRSGRFPTWTPHIYAGAPYFAANHPAVFSPFRLVDYVWPGVEAIAWSQLLKALIAGFGAYLFFRRVLGATWSAAVTGAAAFPLCGYMILWQGFTLSQVAAWLPWALLATDAAVRRPFGAGAIGLAFTTTLLMVSGHAANAGHVLVASALWAGWRAFDVHRGGGATAIAKALASVTVAWIVGFALSAPQLLPTLEYMQQSLRIASRADGHVETPPMGFGALWQVVFPYALGSSERGSLMIVPVARPESAAAAYAGLIAATFLAPLAFADASKRRFAVFLAALGAFALVPLLGVPVLEGIYRLPPLSLLRNNRFAIVTAFSILSLAVIGLDALARGRVRWRAWQWIPLVACAGLAAWSAASVIDPPVVPEAAREFEWFRRVHRVGFVIALVAVGAWFALRRWPHARLVQVVAPLVVVELFVQSVGVCPQVDRKYDYPRLAVLDEIVRRGGTAPGASRVIGLNCLAPNTLTTYGLREVRGYDAADPVRIVELLRAQRDPEAPPESAYAVTLAHVPKHPSPISDVLSLRWIVIPGEPPPGVHATFLGGYSLFENTSALPRVTVPRRVEVEIDRTRRLARLGADDFRPSEEAFVETTEPLGLPPEARGSARIVVDEPERVVIELDLATRALVRLADAYDAGWKATVDGREAPVRITDHALRGVVADAGAKRLEFRYEPRSFRIGLWIGALALGSICAWAFALRRREIARRHLHES